MWPRLAASALALALAHSFSAFFKRLWLVAQQLWHEIFAFLFLVLALAGASTVVREWRAGMSIRVPLALGFTVMMAWFGFTSLRSARRIRHPH